MLRKVLWVNLLVLSLLMIQCESSSNSNSSNTTNVNTATPNATSPRATPVSANSNAPNANAPRPNQELVPPPEKMPRHDELGNDANPADEVIKPTPNTGGNSNTGRKPRIEERKPPEREKP
jgi:hypothetical protein